MHSNVTSKNVSWPHFSWTTLYRPPTTGPDATFFNELSDILDTVGDVIDCDRFMCCGDFNCGGDDDTSVCPELLMVLDAHGLQQLVQSPTRTTDKCRSLLDLVICSSSSTRVSQVAVHPSYQLSDHDLVTWSLSALVKPKPQLVPFTFGSLKKVDWACFQEDLRQSALFTSPSDTADGFAEQLDAVCVDALDKHCPLQLRKRFMSARRVNRWLSTAVVNAKRQRHQLK